MRLLVVSSMLLGLSGAAVAQYQPYNQRAYDTYGRSNPNYHYVQPHQRQDGSTVGGHYRTNPDNNRYNNYNSPTDRYGNPNSRRGLY